jgi:dTMP kinase
MFITFEGVEGSGKTTQAERLRKRLEALGRAVWKTREPGGTPLAEAIRQIVLTPDRAVAAIQSTHIDLAGMETPIDAVTPVAELLLMNAARAQLVQEIRRRLAAREIVICDRYADATLAYQGGGRGIPREVIVPVIAVAIDDLRPDLTILLDLDPRKGLKRKSTRRDGDDPNWNRLDGEALEFHRRVRAAYLALAAEEPRRWHVLDATQPASSVAAQIWEAVEKRLREIGDKTGL